MHSPFCGERKSEGAEPGVQIEHRAAPPDAAQDLLDEEDFGRWARL